MKAADEAIQEWSKRFPEKAAVIVASEQSDDLSYVFLFKREAAYVFCRITCHVAPPENTRDELFFLSDGTGIGEVAIEVIVKSQMPEVRLGWRLSNNEVSDLFSKIVSHEVFTLGNGQGLEPGAIALDGFSVLLLRQFINQPIK